MCIQITDPDHPDISCVGCRDLNIARVYMYPHAFKIPWGHTGFSGYIHTYKVYTVNAGQTCTKCKAKNACLTRRIVRRVIGPIWPRSAWVMSHVNAQSRSSVLRRITLYRTVSIWELHEQLVVYRNEYIRPDSRCHLDNSFLSTKKTSI